MLRRCPAVQATCYSGERLLADALIPHKVDAFHLAGQYPWLPYWGAGDCPPPREEASVSPGPGGAAAAAGANAVDPPDAEPLAAGAPPATEASAPEPPPQLDDAAVTVLLDVLRERNPGSAEEVPPGSAEADLLRLAERMQQSLDLAPWRARSAAAAGAPQLDQIAAVGLHPDGYVVDAGKDVNLMEGYADLLQGADIGELPPEGASRAPGRGAGTLHPWDELGRVLCAARGHLWKAGATGNVRRAVALPLHPQTPARTSCSLCRRACPSAWTGGTPKRCWASRGTNRGRRERSRRWWRCLLLQSGSRTPAGRAAARPAAACCSCGRAATGSRGRPSWRTGPQSAGSCSVSLLQITWPTQR
jgi:hypothetical protein